MSRALAGTVFGPWTAHADDESDDVFWFNSDTGESVWDDPRGEPAAATATAPPAAVTAAALTAGAAALLPPAPVAPAPAAGGARGGGIMDEMQAAFRRMHAAEWEALEAPDVSARAARVRERAAYGRVGGLDAAQALLKEAEELRASVKASDEVWREAVSWPGPALASLRLEASRLTAATGHTKIADDLVRNMRGELDRMRAAPTAAPGGLAAAAAAAAAGDATSGAAPSSPAPAPAVPGPGSAMRRKSVIVGGDSSGGNVAAMLKAVLAQLVTVCGDVEYYETVSVCAALFRVWCLRDCGVFSLAAFLWGNFV